MSTAEKLAPIANSIRLVQAVLCANCEMITDSTGESCLVCGSKSLLSIARVLGGSAEPWRAAVVQPAPEELRSRLTLLVQQDASHHVPRRRFRQLHLTEKSGS